MIFSLKGGGALCDCKNAIKPSLMKKKGERNEEIKLIRNTPYYAHCHVHCIGNAAWPYARCHDVYLRGLWRTATTLFIPGSIVQRKIWTTGNSEWADIPEQTRNKRIADAPLPWDARLSKRVSWDSAYAPCYRPCISLSIKRGCNSWVTPSPYIPYYR